MEPFALLNLLKTLLPDAPQQTPPAPAQKEESPAPTPPAEEDKAPEQRQSEPYNACVSFWEEHERRAKKTRK